VPDPDGTPEQPGEAEDVSSEPASITGIPFMMTKDMRFLARRPTSGAIGPQLKTVCVGGLTFFTHYYIVIFYLGNQDAHDLPRPRSGRQDADR
jgi:hypothetical protein